MSPMLSAAGRQPTASMSLLYRRGPESSGNVTCRSSTVLSALNTPGPAEGVEPGETIAEVFARRVSGAQARRSSFANQAGEKPASISAVPGYRHTRGSSSDRRRALSPARHPRRRWCRDVRNAESAGFAAVIPHSDARHHPLIRGRRVDHRSPQPTDNGRTPALPMPRTGRTYRRAAMRHSGILIQCRL